MKTDLFWKLQTAMREEIQFSKKVKLNVNIKVLETQIDKLIIK